MLDINSLVIHNPEWGFCHIPKNGGSNFKIHYRQQHTQKYSGIQLNITQKHLFYHQPPSWFEEQGIRPKQWICISRNPYSRYVSWFFFIKRRQEEGKNDINWSKYAFEDFVVKHLLEKSKEHPKRLEFTSQGGLWWASDEQSFWIKNTPNMKVFRLENGLKDMEDYTNTKFTHTQMNSSEHDAWETYYTKELKDLVYERYSEDFRIFAYER